MRKAALQGAALFVADTEPLILRQAQDEAYCFDLK
jgi:hypothetical protein